MTGGAVTRKHPTRKALRHPAVATTRRCICILQQAFNTYCMESKTSRHSQEVMNIPSLLLPQPLILLASNKNRYKRQCTGQRTEKVKDYGCSSLGNLIDNSTIIQPLLNSAPTVGNFSPSTTVLQPPNQPLPNNLSIAFQPPPTRSSPAIHSQPPPKKARRGGVASAP